MGFACSLFVVPPRRCASVRRCERTAEPLILVSFIFLFHLSDESPSMRCPFSRWPSVHVSSRQQAVSPTNYFSNARGRTRKHWTTFLHPTMRYPDACLCELTGSDGTACVAGGYPGSSLSRTASLARTSRTRAPRLSR